MSKPGKGLISTSRTETQCITTMNLLMKAGKKADQGLVNAAKWHARNLWQEISDLAVIDCKNMNAGEIADFSAFLISLSHSIQALREQAATVGNNDLAASFANIHSNLESTIGLHMAAPNFAGIYNQMKGAS